MCVALHFLYITHQKILRLDIPMANSKTMNICQSSTHLHKTKQEKDHLINHVTLEHMHPPFSSHVIIACLISPDKCIASHK